MSITKAQLIAGYEQEYPALTDIVNGQPVVVPEERRQEIFSGWADAALEELSKAESKRIAAINSEAQRIITAQFPSWKQHNMNREYAKLQGKYLILPLTEDRARMDRLESDFAWIDAVVAESDRLCKDPSATPSWPDYQ